MRIFDGVPEASVPLNWWIARHKAHKKGRVEGVDGDVAVISLVCDDCKEVFIYDEYFAATPPKAEREGS